MNVNIVLASHGTLARGMKESVELIAGKQSNVSTMCAYTEPNFDLQKAVKRLIEDYGDEHIVVITDIFGGSVNNEFMRYVNRNNFSLIAGMSMPLVIDLITKLNTCNSIDSSIESSIDSMKDNVIYCNQLVTSDSSAEEDF